ncbi:MAG: lysyl oxidase family protein [Saprospiraceae bacterium]
MRSAHFLLSFFLFFASFLSAFAQCPAGQDSVRVEINSDFYYDEVSWAITSLDGSIVYGAGTLPDAETHSYTYCVPSAECVRFTIMDDAADGMFPDGWYRLFVNENLVHESIVGTSFGYMESVSINCPPGTSCNSPLDLSVGAGTTPTGDEVWYSFTPDSTGTYFIATCDAACPTKIWVYGQCVGIFIAENQLGTVFYADSGCPDGSAAASLNLEGGKEYFIRLRYSTVECSTDPIPYTLNYLGPVVGCMDPTACNYEPLATVSGDSCIYPGDPACPNAPDLEMGQELLTATLTFSSMENPDPCAVEEGCLRGLGTRHLIEFSTHIKNIGGADYYIGETPQNITDPSDQFVWDPCHHHWHYLGYADYLLYNSDGLRVPIGSKTGFCVLDLECADGGFGLYDCDNMGISAGCGDVYDIGLPCQWIDITGVPADNYTMVVRVNWDKSPDKVGRIEKTYENNWAQACFNLSYTDETPEVLFNFDSCQQFTDCSGVVFGDAQPDCNGVCNGPALFGDWNQDTLRNSADVLAYLTSALASNGTATSCNDLHDDGQINVFDAALLQECNIHADNQQHWIQRFPCQFPTGFLNTKDLVSILPGTLDTVAKTFDIQIANPLNPIMAYELAVSGLVIQSVQNLATEHQTVPMFNPATGKIIALAANESSIKKNPVPTPFLRVHYSSLTANKVCVAQIIAVVNNKYQQSNATLAAPNCVPVNTVAASEPSTAPFAVFVQPNPMGESTTVFFENKNAEPMTFTLTDLMGRTLRSFTGLRGESVNIPRDALPEGTYIFTLRGSRGSVSGKLVCQN